MKTVSLNRLMVLEAPSTTPDGAGGGRNDWTVLGQLWVQLKRRSHRQRNDAGVDLKLSRVEIITRAAPDGSSMRPQPGQRLVEGVGIYRIQSVGECDAQGLYLSILATQEQIA